LILQHMQSKLINLGLLFWQVIPCSISVKNPQISEGKG